MLGKRCQSSHIPSEVFCWGGLCYPCQPGSSGGLRGPAGLGTAPSQRPQAVVLLWACQLCHFLSGIRLGGDSGSPQPVTRPQPKEASARKISVLSACPSGTDKNTRRGPRPALWPRKQTLVGWLTSSSLSPTAPSPRRLLGRSLVDAATPDTSQAPGLL